MADEQLRGKRKLNESMLASASIERTPHVGLVTSSFAGGKEHDGTPITGLASPRRVDAELSNSELQALVNRALDLSRAGRRVGGIGPEDRVLIKIVVTPEVSTDVRLVGAVLERMLAARQGKRITIVEDSAAPAGYASMIAGLAANHRSVRIEYLNLGEVPYITSPPLRRTYAGANPTGAYALAKLFRECDRIVTIAPLRTSPDTGVALSAATYRSFASRVIYGQQREKLAALGDAADVTTDLYLHHPPDFAILGGPLHFDGAAVRHNIVIAGRNALAVDAVGAAVMGFDPRKIRLLDRLEARGFGVCDPDSIWTHGNEIEEARRPFARPAGWSAL
ncbi:MAG: DUF362 domain-containing protein [Acidobacteria bacterium]|nr:DUF362 domain-containing protein [Acidobacteriota bacterium]